MPDEPKAEGKLGIENGQDDVGQAPAPVSSPLIPLVTLPPENRQLRFSFRHLDIRHDKFRLSDCCAEFLRLLVERLRDYSGWRVDDFCDQNNDEHRHVINFPDTSEREGFTGIEADQLQYHDAWQFELCREQSWRIHGMLIDDTFFVIWLDSNHRLYPK